MTRKISWIGKNPGKRKITTDKELKQESLKLGDYITDGTSIGILSWKDGKKCRIDYMYMTISGLVQAHCYYDKDDCPLKWKKLELTETKEKEIKAWKETSLKFLETENKLHNKKIKDLQKTHQADTIRVSDEISGFCDFLTKYMNFKNKGYVRGLLKKFKEEAEKKC